MILSYKEQKCKTPKESVASALFMVYAKERKKGGIDLEQGICAFTGHRPGHFAFGYEQGHPDCVRLKHAIGQAVSILIQQGVTTFISGMAQGVDLWAAREVLRQKAENPMLRLIAAQPCADQAQRWPQAARREYEDILAVCDERFCLYERYTHSCMMERNRWMVDRSGILLAVYDGSAGGGTAATVRYAQSKQREIWLLDPDTLCLVALTPPEKQISFDDTFLSGQTV